ncbi:MAG: translation initiation factor [Verrucomicrobiota bacterium]
MAKKHDKFTTDGGSDLGQNPFGGLAGLNLPSGPAAGAITPSPTPAASKRGQPNTNRGRVEIRRSTAGRGGKTVTVVDGFVGIGLPEKEQLAKTMQKVCGCGGTVKDGRIEIQGDKRDVVAKVLSDAGFRPVMAGG